MREREREREDLLFDEDSDEAIRFGEKFREDGSNDSSTNDDHLI